MLQKKKKKKFAIGMFVDLQKAFNTTDHLILLSKLEKYGIRGVARNWIKSYLTEKQQFVKMGSLSQKV